MFDQAQLDRVFQDLGYTDYKWIRAEDIEVAQWVRFKCMFGCGEYGHSAVCPPNVPPVPECRRFFSEYRHAAILHFSTTVEQPEDRHAWTRKINGGLTKLERAVSLSGYHKAFLLFMDTCTLCQDCTSDRRTCNLPRAARPSPESLAVDVYATVRKYGFPVEVLTSYGQAMNRYAFLLVE